MNLHRDMMFVDTIQCRKQLFEIIYRKINAILIQLKTQNIFVKDRGENYISPENRGCRNQDEEAGNAHQRPRVGHELFRGFDFIGDVALLFTFQGQIERQRAEKVFETIQIEISFFVFKYMYLDFYIAKVIFKIIIDQRIQI